MGQRQRIHYSAEQRAEIWDRWRRGESMSSIGRRFDRESSSVFSVLSPSGGIRPAERRRPARALSMVEREEVSRGLVAGRSLRAIAVQLGRAPSTISREVGRNGGRDRYRTTRSDQAAWSRALRPKALQAGLSSGLVPNSVGEAAPQMVARADRGLAQAQLCSQEQHRVSHETIYKSLYVQARGVLKKELLEHLRAKRAIRRSRHASLKRDGLGQIRDAISISQRPACIEDRAVPGHWEGDLISGARGSHVVTLVERRSRYVILAKVANKQTSTVVEALIGQARKLPGELRRSLTWDRGKELADHRRFTLATDVTVYFCDPQSPWQRGTNENTNRLLRQYLPKGIDLSAFSQVQLSAIARQLNERPRKTLMYQTPAERFAQAVATTG